MLSEQHTWLREIATNSLRDPVKFWAKMEALPMVQGTVSHDVTNAIEQVMPEANLSYGFRRRRSGLGSLGRPRFVALAAAAAAAGAVAALNERRAAEHRPTTDFYLGLHVGEVFYGNIGSQRRLDFTVVGPAVNEAARIAAMCRSADRPLLLSSAFAAALADPARLASVGRYALRGFGRPQELFTLDPDA